MIKRQFVCIAILSCLASKWVNAADIPHYSSVTEALSAAHHSRDQAARRAALAATGMLPALSDKEMRTLVNNLAGLGVQTQNADDQTNQNIVKEAGAINSALSLSTATALQPVVAQLLSQEVDRLPAGFTSPEEIVDPAQRARMLCLYARLDGLLRAAEGGKNYAALAVIRRLAAKGGYALTLASRPLGTLGDSTDLDSLINTVKQNPHAQIDLSGFGPVLVDRLIQEISKPSVSPEQVYRLSSFISVVSRHDLLPKYRALLRSPKPPVVHAAAIGIYRSLMPADQGLIQEMLTDPSSSVRVQALAALRNKRLWNDGLIPNLKAILQNDPNEMVRAQAATLLGSYHASSSVETLTQALQDPSMFVRTSAQFALKRIKG